MKLFRLFPLFAALAMIAGAGVAGPTDNLIGSLNDPVVIKHFHTPDKASRGGEIRLAFELAVNAPWHINAHKVNDEFLVPTTIEFDLPDGFEITQIIFPDGEEKKLEFSETPMNLYEGIVLVGAVLKVAPEVPVGPATVKAILTYQACDNEKCLIPETRDIYVQLNVADATTAVEPLHSEVFDEIDFAASASLEPDGGSGTVGNIFAQNGLVLAFVLVFLGGLALNLTPCVYPLIPITVSYFGGQSGGKDSKKVLMAVMYLLGMATMYSILGLIAALTGSLLGAALQNPLVLSFVALVMVGLALSMFGLYEIRIPAAIAGVAGTAKQGVVGAFLMGITVGVVAAPCIGPFVLGLLTWVGEQADPVLGFSMFFVLALGLGLPFVFLAIASGSISKLPKSGEWMEWIRYVFGVVLLGMALYFLDPVLPDAVYFVALGVLLIGGGILLGFIVKVATGALFFSALRRFVGVAAPLAGLYLIFSPGHVFMRSDAHHGIDWAPYNVSALNAAQKESKTVVIDFSADWCLPCKELDHRTFNQPEVVEASSRFVPLKADLTKTSSQEVKALRSQYGIRGVPTLVFIDAQGKERTDLRTVGFINKKQFLEKVNSLRGGETR